MTNSLLTVSASIKFIGRQYCLVILKCCLIMSGGELAGYFVYSVVCKFGLLISYHTALHRKCAVHCDSFGACEGCGMCCALPLFWSV